MTRLCRAFAPDAVRVRSYQYALGAQEFLTELLLELPLPPCGAV